MTMRSNTHRILRLCRQIGAIDPGSREAWSTYYTLLPKLAAAIVASAFFADWMHVSANAGEIGPTRASQPIQLEWDILTDAEARDYRDIFTGLAFTPTTADSLASAIGMNLDTMEARLDVLMESGHVIYADDFNMQLSAVGMPIGKYFQSDPDAIRPPFSARHRNRRRR